MRVLFVADLSKGRTGSQRCAAMHRLGHSVTEVDTSESRPTGFRGIRRFIDKIALRLGYHLDVDGLSRRVLAAAQASNADILWLDKVLSLSPAFFNAFKTGKVGRKIVIYHPDDFRSR